MYYPHQWNNIISDIVILLSSFLLLVEINLRSHEKIKKKNQLCLLIQSCFHFSDARVTGQNYRFIVINFNVKISCISYINVVEQKYKVALNGNTQVNARRYFPSLMSDHGCSLITWFSSADREPQIFRVLIISQIFKINKQTVPDVFYDVPVDHLMNHRLVQTETETKVRFITANWNRNWNRKNIK